MENPITFVEQARVAMIVWKPVLAFLVAMTFGVWLLVKGMHANRIADFESRLALKDGEIADYKRKLDGASPNEAKAHMDALQREVDRLKPRRVTAEQRDAVTRVAAQAVGVIDIASDMACADAPRVATSLAAAFRAAGWTVATPSVMGLSNAPLSGVAVEVANAAQLTPIEAAALEALRASGLPYEVQQRGAPPPSMRGIRPRDVSIVISAPIHD